MMQDGGVPQDADSRKKLAARKGKAVMVDHFLFDELWNSGNRKMPAEVQIKGEEPSQNDKAEEEKEMASASHDGASGAKNGKEN